MAHAHSAERPDLGPDQCCVAQGICERYNARCALIERGAQPSLLNSEGIRSELQILPDEKQVFSKLVLFMMRVNVSA